MEAKQAYHLPFSFLRVRVLTSPWSGRCNLILTLPILDNDSCPPFTPNPAWGYVNESYQPLPLQRGNPRPRRKNAWYVLIYTVQHILKHLRIHLAQRRVGCLAGGQLRRLHGVKIRRCGTTSKPRAAL